MSSARPCLLLLSAIPLFAQTTPPMVTPGYSISAYQCRTPTGCQQPSELRRAAWSAITTDHLEQETGSPFSLESAAGPAFYAKSAVAILGASITISHRVEMANLSEWTHPVKSGRGITRRVSHRLASVGDKLTVTGGSGQAYLLPVYEVQGTFVSAGEKYLESSLEICFGIAGGCRPKSWDARQGTVSIQESYQPAIYDILRFEYGKQFTYHARMNTVVSPRATDENKVPPETFRQDEAADFTVRLLGFSIVDAEGKVIPGAQITAESGFPYKILPPLPR
jgi:hypothetical protein